MIKLEKNIQIKSQHFNEEKKGNYVIQETVMIIVKQNSKTLVVFVTISSIREKNCWKMRRVVRVDSGSA